MKKKKKKIERVPENKKCMIDENEKIIDTVDHILYFNQSGHWLKVLIPNQILSRSPIFLAQLNAGNNSEKLWTKLANYCILCTDQKYLPKTFMKVWSTLFKNGNNH